MDAISSKYKTVINDIVSLQSCSICGNVGIRREITTWPLDRHLTVLKTVNMVMKNHQQGIVKEEFVNVLEMVAQ